MGALLVYLLKVAVAAVVFYLFLRILMEKETLHGLVRGLWLGAMLFSLLLPLSRLDLPSGFPRIAVLGIEEAGVTGGESPALTVDTEAIAAFDWTSFLGIAYLCGLAVTVLLYLVGYLRLALSLRRLGPAREFDALLEQCREAVGCRAKVRLCLATDENAAPFSWMRTIVVSRTDLEENGRDILLHELGHVRGLHSADVLFADIFTCLQWFNPAAWLLRASLRQVHEYCADSAVIRSGSDIRSYQTLLIRKAAGHTFNSIANNFNHNKLKNRIAMMYRNQNSKRALVKSLAMLPLLGCFFLVFSAFSPKAEPTAADSAAPEAFEAPAVQNQSDEKTKPVSYSATEVKPTFGNGDANAFALWVNENIKYPKEAYEKKIEGRVMVGFTIDVDGKVKDVEVMRSSGSELLDAEALRAVSASPDWIPGEVGGKKVPVTFMMPLVFKVN